MRETEPTRIITRETLEWTKSYADYPASLWTLAYYFRGPGVGFDAAGVADGDDFVITVPTTTTDNVTVAGKYKWEAWVTEIADATNTPLVGSGYAFIELALNPASTAAVDLRTAAKIALDSIDAAMAAFATTDVMEYEISTPAGSRRVKRSARSDLMNLRKYYAGIVARENAMEEVRNGRTFARPVLARLHDA